MPPTVTSADPADDFDTILERLGGGGGGAASADPMLTMMMMQMQNDRADRAAQRQTMLQLATAVLPAVLPLLFKKDADPLVMTLLQGTLAKNNDGEQLKQMLQMMAAANQMTMEQLKSSLLSIMEMKDQQTKKLLEDRADEDSDEPKSGPAAIMQEVRLGLTALAGLAGSAPAAAAPAPALPAPNPGACSRCGSAFVNGVQQCKCMGARDQRPRQPPVVVLLHQMRGIQTGEITGNLGAAWAAMATIALQDPQLLAAIDSDDIQQVVAYCQPHIVADPKLLQWVSGDGVAAWVDQMVQRKLIPLIDVARDDGTDDSEPEELTAEEAAGADSNG